MSPVDRFVDDGLKTKKRLMIRICAVDILIVSVVHDCPVTSPKFLDSVNFL